MSDTGEQDEQYTDPRGAVKGVIALELKALTE